MNLSFSLFLSTVAAAATLIPLSGFYDQPQVKSNNSNSFGTVNQDLEFMAGPFVLDDGSVFDDIASAHRHLQSRIIGGSRIPEGRYPYITPVLVLQALEDGRGVLLGLCSGALIHPNVVMTAATCTNNVTDFHGIVLNVTKGSDPPDGYGFTRFFSTHPDFNNQTKYPNTAAPQNFALIYINTAEGIQPLAISADTPPVGSSFTAIGNGVNDTDSPLGNYPNPEWLINEVDMTRIDAGTCQDIRLPLWEFPENATDFNDDIMICAHDGPGTGICFRDWGGPLIVKGGDASEDVAYGLSSFWSVNYTTTEPIEDCGEYPSTFTRINQDILDWTERFICFYTDPVRSGTPAENAKNRPASCPPLTTLAPATAAPVTAAPAPNPTVAPATTAPVPAPVVAPPAGAGSSSSDGKSGKSKKMSGKSGKKGSKKRAKLTTTELLRGGW